MSLIVYGHVAHATTVPLTPPIYLKQFGVAFFLFATGFTLARERRGAGETVFNRLFQVYLFGLSLAFLLTILSVVGGRPRRAQQLSAVCRRAQRGREQLSGESDDLVPGHLCALHADLGGVAPPHPCPDLDGAGGVRDRDSDSRVPHGVRRDVRRLHAVDELGRGVPPRHGARSGRRRRSVRASHQRLCGGARRRPRGVGRRHAVPAVRADVPVHVADRLAAGRRPAVRVRERVVAVRRHHGAAVRSDPPRRDDAGAGGVHRPQFADHFPGAHAGLLPAAAGAGGVDDELLDESGDPAARLPAWPGAGVRGDRRAWSAPGSCAGGYSNGSPSAAGSADTPAWPLRNEAPPDEAARRRDRALLQLRRRAGGLRQQRPDPAGRRCPRARHGRRVDRHDRGRSARGSPRRTRGSSTGATTVNRGHIATYNEALATADRRLLHGALRRRSADAGRAAARDPRHGRASGGRPHLRSRHHVHACAARRVGAGGGVLRRTGSCGTSNSSSARAASGHTPIQAPTVVVRTSLHRQIGDYLLELPHTADTEIWLRMAATAPSASCTRRRRSGVSTRRT